MSKLPLGLNTVNVRKLSEPVGLPAGHPWGFTLTGALLSSSLSNSICVLTTGTPKKACEQMLQICHSHSLGTSCYLPKIITYQWQLCHFYVWSFILSIDLVNLKHNYYSYIYIYIDQLTKYFFSFFFYN